jgi:tetratricopeptide (TPR) repeat protein
MNSDVDQFLPILLEERTLTEAGKKKLDKIARRILKMKPEKRSADENFVLGYAADMVYDLDGAVTYFTDAIRENPDFEAAYRFRASALLRQEKYGDAESDINKALELDPDYRDAKLDRARLLHETGKSADALAIVAELEESSREVDDGDGDGDVDINITLLKGKIFDRMARYDDAIACYDKVADAVDDDSEVYTQRALSRFFSGDAPGALTDMQTALKSGPQGHIGHFNMGLILLAFPDRTKDAFRYFERAFKKDSDMLKNYLASTNEFESERLYDAMKERLTTIKKEDDEQGRFYRDQLVDLLERKLP